MRADGKLCVYEPAQGNPSMAWLLAQYEKKLDREATICNLDETCLNSHATLERISVDRGFLLWGDEDWLFFMQDD